MRIQPISFKKTLIKNCTIPDKKNHPTPCGIYKLDLPEDRYYFTKLLKDKKWDGNKYLDDIDDSIRIDGEYENNYVLESENGECLGFICTTDEPKFNAKEVDYLETCPYYAKQNPERDLKYIGETLLAFVVELAKKGDFNSVIIPFPAKRAVKFYMDKCGFIQGADGVAKIMCKKDYHKLIEQNKKHTENL